MATIRIDKLLWHLRFVRSRTLAQALVGEGHVRLNGRRVERSAQGVAAGDIVAVPLLRRVLVIELAAIPARRGSAEEAQACYRVLDERPAFPIAAARFNPLEQAHHEGDPPP